MPDLWSDSDLTGCWADVYDDDHEEMQACEAAVPKTSSLGLCAGCEKAILGSSMPR